MRGGNRQMGYVSEPVGICDASGFKVPLRNLVKQWDGMMVDRRFLEKRNPQDFVKGVPDRSNLPFARPESPDVFVGVVTPDDL